MRAKSFMLNVKLVFHYRFVTANGHFFFHLKTILENNIDYRLCKMVGKKQCCFPIAISDCWRAGSNLEV